MPIKVTCQCGKSFAAKDELAGKRLDCPNCNNPLEIPRVSQKPDSTAGDSATPPIPSATPPITVVCVCGARFGAKASLAGTETRCPRCGEPLKIPQPQSTPSQSDQSHKNQPQTTAQKRQSQQDRTQRPQKKQVAQKQGPVAAPLDDLLDDVGLTASKTGQRCPECRADWQPGSVLCVHCGYNAELGKQIKTRRDRFADEDASLPESVRKAMKEVRHEKVNQVAGSGRGVGAWIVGVILFGGAGLIIVIAAVSGQAVGQPGPGAQPVATTAIMSFALLAGFAMSCGGWIWLTVIAFKDHLYHGLGCLFVPPYGLVYTVLHWEDCHRPFMVALAGIFVWFAVSFI